MFLHSVGPIKCDPSIRENLYRLGCLLSHAYNNHRDRELFCTALKRMAWREKRSLTYVDVLEIATYGMAEEESQLPDKTTLYRTAVHEAGHALVTCLRSTDKLPPTYCSILDRSGHLGSTVRAFESHELSSDDLSYRDYIYIIQSSLAGRVAENLMLGADAASAYGSFLDLEEATRISRLLFGKRGYSTDISTPENACSNLLVAADECTTSMNAYLETTIRQFLQQQFMNVLNLFQENKYLLEKIIASLLSKKMLVAEDFEEILK